MIRDMGEGNEEVPEQHPYGGNTRLPKWMTEEEKAQFAQKVQSTKDIRMTDADPEFAGLKGLWRKHEVTPDETKEIESLLEIAQGKINELGIAPGSVSLPNIDEISIAVVRNSILVKSADTSEFAEHINFYVKSVKEGDPLKPKVFFHELYHYLAKKNVTIDHTRNEARFQASSQGITPISHHETQGIPFEGMAEIFALYCLEQPTDGATKLLKNFPIQEVAYISNFAFDIALIERFAHIKNISTKEAVKVFLKANIKGDYSFYSDLVEAFGLSAVHEFNNMGEKTDQMVDAAAEGGFLHEFKEIESRLENNKFVDVPGLNIQARKRIFPPQHQTSKMRSKLLEIGYMFDIKPLQHIRP